MGVKGIILVPRGPDGVGWGLGPTSAPARLELEEGEALLLRLPLELLPAEGEPFTDGCSE